MLKKILIISPAFPPAINGLGDYSVILGRVLEQKALHVSYAGLLQKEIVQLSPYYTITKKQTITTIIEKTNINLVFINYSNYGYQKKGIPLWLLRDLKQTKKRGLKILTFFHEVYASGKTWQSVYWLKPLQKNIFHQLYQLSDFCFCSNNRVLNIIKDETHDRGLKARNIGIFSNIPEINKPKHWSTREDKAVVFGSLGRRNAVYKNQVVFQKILKELGIKEIIDIGPGDTSYILQMLKLPHQAKNELSADEISKILLQSKWAFIDYHDSLLGKSGIFAAYASHGLVIINLNQDNENENDYLLKGKNYLVYSDLKKDYSQISLNIFSWYQRRNLETHSDKVLQVICSFDYLINQ